MELDATVAQPERESRCSFVPRRGITAGCVVRVRLLLLLLAVANVVAFDVVEKSAVVELDVHGVRTTVSNHRRGKPRLFPVRRRLDSLTLALSLSLGCVVGGDRGGADGDARAQRGSIAIRTSRGAADSRGSRRRVQSLVRRVVFRLPARVHGGSNGVAHRARRVSDDRHGGVVLQRLDHLLLEVGVRCPSQIAAATKRARVLVVVRVHVVARVRTVVLVALVGRIQVEAAARAASGPTRRGGIRRRTRTRIHRPRPRRPRALAAASARVLRARRGS